MGHATRITSKSRDAAIKSMNNNPQPVFSSRAVLMNFLVLVLCSQFAFAVLAMKGALLPQMLELWNISKTQFGVLMSIYGIVHNIFYVCLLYTSDAADE